MQSREIITDITRRIVERTAPERVILYGPHARGEAGAGSRGPEANGVGAVPRGAGLPVAEGPGGGDHGGIRALPRNTIYHAAGSEGEVLYERHACFTISIT